MAFYAQNVKEAFLWIDVHLQHFFFSAAANQILQFKTFFKRQPTFFNFFELVPEIMFRQLQA
jgi:hypothetical protein